MNQLPNEVLAGQTSNTANFKAISGAIKSQDPAVPENSHSVQSVYIHYSTFEVPFNSVEVGYAKNNWPDTPPDIKNIAVPFVVRNITGSPELEPFKQYAGLPVDGQWHWYQMIRGDKYYPGTPGIEHWFATFFDSNFLKWVYLPVATMGAARAYGEVKWSGAQQPQMGQADQYLYVINADAPGWDWQLWSQDIPTRRDVPSEPPVCQNWYKIDWHNDTTLYYWFVDWTVHKT